MQCVSTGYKRNIGAPNLFLCEINIVCDWIVVEDVSTIVVRRVLIVIGYEL